MPFCFIVSALKRFTNSPMFSRAARAPGRPGAPDWLRLPDTALDLRLDFLLCHRIDLFALGSKLHGSRPLRSMRSPFNRSRPGTEIDFLPQRTQRTQRRKKCEGAREICASFCFAVLAFLCVLCGKKSIQFRTRSVEWAAHGFAAV